MHITLELFGHTFSTYGFLALSGILFGFIYIAVFSKRYDIKADDAFYVYAYTLIALGIGAKLLFILVSMPAITADIRLIIGENISSVTLVKYLTGGFVFYGGLIGAIFGAILSCKYFNLDFNKMLPVILPATIILSIFGRIGCFMAGCCYGRETASFIGVTFPEGGLAPAGIKLIPTQLIEAVLDIFILIAVIIVLNKEKLRIYALPFYIITYSTMRFILEFFRGDPDRGFIGILSVSQCISILLMVISVVYIVKHTSDNTTTI